MIRDILPWLLLLTPLPPIAMVIMLVEHVWSDNMALRERVGLAIRDSLVAMVIALVSANHLFDWNLPEGVLVVLGVLSVIAISVPSIIWIALYFREGYR